MGDQHSPSVPKNQSLKWLPLSER